MKSPYPSVRRLFGLLLASLLAGGFVPCLQAGPAHGLDFGGFGRALQPDEVEAFLDRGRRFEVRKQQLQPLGDWYRGSSQYYLLGDERSMLAVGIGKETLSGDYFKSGVQLIRMHETGVPIANQLSSFASLGWPQSNPDLRVFPQIDAVLSASTGDLRAYPIGPYASEGLLLVAPDRSRIASRQAYGPVLLMEPGKGLVGMIWPSEKTLAEARDQVRAEGRRLGQTGRYDHGSQFGLFEPYANHKWLSENFSWYQRDGQWHLRGLGSSTEPEPRSTDFKRFLKAYYQHLIETGEPLPWRNFGAAHPGVRALAHDDPRLQGSYFAGNQLPLAFEFARPQDLLGLRVEAFGLAGKHFSPRLYTRMPKEALLAAMTRHFAGLGLRMERLNEDHHVIRGGAGKLFVQVYATHDPDVLVVHLANHGHRYCVECHADD